MNMPKDKLRKGSFFLPITLAALGIAAVAVTLTYILIRKVEEEWVGDADVENYEMKNVPLF